MILVLCYHNTVTTCAQDASEADGVFADRGVTPQYIFSKCNTGVLGDMGHASQVWWYPGSASDVVFAPGKIPPQPWRLAERAVVRIGGFSIAAGVRKEERAVVVSGDWVAIAVVG